MIRTCFDLLRQLVQVHLPTGIAPGETLQLFRPEATDGGITAPSANGIDKGSPEGQLAVAVFRGDRSNSATTRFGSLVIEVGQIAQLGGVANKVAEFGNRGGDVGHKGRGWSSLIAQVGIQVHHVLDDLKTGWAGEGEMDFDVATGMMADDIANPTH